MAKWFINKALCVGFEKKYKIFTSVLAEIKNCCIFALALQKICDGPFVYRLGRQVFILVRGVRFPYGLQISFEIVL